MFSNIGAKIKTIVIVFFILGLVSCCITAFGVYAALADIGTDNATATGAAIVAFILLAFVAWLSCLAMYAFGQIAEDTEIINEQFRYQLKNSAYISNRMDAMLEQVHYIAIASQAMASTTSKTDDSVTLEKVESSPEHFILDTWDCPRCNKKGNIARFCTSCGKRR